MGSGRAHQQQTPPVLLASGPCTVQAVSTDYWCWRHWQEIRQMERE